MPIITLPNRKLNESNPAPLYYQLRELIANAIETNKYGPEYQLPSERELAEKYSLSRMTVRQATTSLVNDGTLVRRRGKGTFVSPPKVDQGLLKLTSFTEDMRQRGMAPSTRLLGMKQIHPSEHAARELGIFVEDTVFVVERLRLADEKPMAYECCHLPSRRFPDLVESDVRGSLYQLFKNKFGITLARARQSLEGTIASQRETELLKVGRGVPLLLLERTTLDENDQAIEFVKSLYRADRYKFHVQMFR